MSKSAKNLYRKSKTFKKNNRISFSNFKRAFKQYKLVTAVIIAKKCVIFILKRLSAQRSCGINVRAGQKGAASAPNASGLARDSGGRLVSGPAIGGRGVEGAADA